jgi:hypothetical protein
MGKNRPKGLKYILHKENPTSFKKGHIPWNKNTKGLCKINSGSIKKGQHLNKKTEFKKGDTLGKKNNQWKGDDVGYYAIHTWIQRTYGKAYRCENRENNILDFNCSKKSDNYDWALLKGKKYKRKGKNFIMLCHSCHLKYDKAK